MEKKTIVEKIPDVTFFKKQKLEIDLDVLTLSKIYSVRHIVDHRIDHDHRINFYFILLITEGSGTHKIDFQPYPYEKGSVLLVSKEQTHAFDNRFQSEGIIILFTENFLTKHVLHSDILFLHRLFNYHLHSPIIHQREQKCESLAPIIHEIYNEYHSSQDFAKEEILRSQLRILLLKAERIKHSLISKDNTPGWVDLFTRFKSLITSFNIDTRNAKDYAERLNISYKHLNAVCRTATGCTAKQFIDTCLILEIKRQLAISNLSVKEIAYRFNFDEPTNFLKYFKKQTSQTPRQFRQKLS